MQLAAHEVQDLHELTVSCVNSITNMALFYNTAQDAELKQLIKQHFPLHVQDYNMKVEFLSQPEGATSTLSPPPLNTSLESYTQAPASNYQPITPRTSIQSLNDREIATAYLLTLKRAGREYAYSAMEAAHPKLRAFLESAFMMSCHHAYDVWQYMVKKGYYPLEAAPDTTLQTLSSIYHLVPNSEPQPLQ